MTDEHFEWIKNRVKLGRRSGEDSQALIDEIERLRKIEAQVIAASSMVTPAPPVKWEYLRATISQKENTLDELGEYGWELVIYEHDGDYTTGIFKRPLMEDHKQ